jgi:hypothetical protein
VVPCHRLGSDCSMRLNKLLAMAAIAAQAGDVVPWVPGQAGGPMVATCREVR